MSCDCRLTRNIVVDQVSVTIHHLSRRGGVMPPVPDCGTRRLFWALSHLAALHFPKAYSWTCTLSSPPVPFVLCSFVVNPLAPEVTSVLMYEAQSRTLGSPLHYLLYLPLSPLLLSFSSLHLVLYLSCLRGCGTSVNFITIWLMNSLNTGMFLFSVTESFFPPHLLPLCALTSTFWLKRRSKGSFRKAVPTKNEQWHVFLLVFSWQDKR